MPAANAAGMNMQMALAAIDKGDMGDCQDCPDGGGDMQACDTGCLSPMLAVISSGQPGLPEVVITVEHLAHRSLAGRTGLPDPYPPRSIIMS
ncbi:MAG: hypothetical protein Q8O63_13885 [Hoeflea sp.]|nr:hypothetical protein [Hoeflea sp.]